MLLKLAVGRTLFAFRETIDAIALSRGQPVQLG
jgi:hypothetical protein